MSFLEQALARMELAAAVVPQELLDEWLADDDTIPASCLMHPRVREGATERDVLSLLGKKEWTLAQRVSEEEFVRCAKRLQKKSAKRASVSEIELADEAEPTMGLREARCMAALNEMVGEPRWSGAGDAAPVRLAPDLFFGSAQHAADVAALRRSGISAVLNVASSVCESQADRYSSEGIAYMEMDAHDFDGYPLLDAHLEAANAFVQEHGQPQAQSGGGGATLVHNGVAAGRGGATLIHCFAGVNRSAALAIAIHTVRSRTPLLQTVGAAFGARPFILSNETFRRQLVKLASSYGLCHDDDASTAARPIDSDPTRPTVADVKVVVSK